MKKSTAVFYILVGLLMSQTAMSSELGSDYVTKPFWSIDKTYRAKYEIDNIVDDDVVCDPSSGFTGATKYAVQSKTIFREIVDDENETLISFDYVNYNGTTGLVLNTEYKLCKEHVKKHKYKRAGGLDTGLLVIPYKVREGDLYGDSTLGPYIAFKGDSFSLLTTFGMTQVSVSEGIGADIKTETGLSYAIGSVWSFTDTFDVGLVVGVDHLSGDAGDDFKYQDEVWWSFAIGYNFTK